MSGQLLGALVFVPKDIVLERCAVDGQLRSQVGSSANSLKVLATIVRHEGLLGFFRAYLPHQYVFVPFNGLTFTFLGMGKDAGSQAGLPTSSVAFSVANTLWSGALAAWLTTPLDLVKTRLQVYNPHYVPHYHLLRYHDK